MLGLSIALIISFIATLACTVASILISERKPLPSSIRFCSPTPPLSANIKYDPILNLCYTLKSAKPFIIFWATPVGSWMLLFVPFIFTANGPQLAFDITVLAFTIYNSLSNPRDFNTTLRRILYRDGILFFLVSIRRYRAICCACSSRFSSLQ